jgi:hypothetical protein
MEGVMGRGYRLAYAVGLTPWERAGATGSAHPEKLIVREEADLGSAGRALDLGCGSGAHAVLLAARGWEVTGVDLVDKALERARQRARERAAKVRFVRGDVAALDPAGIGVGYQLFLDVGCFHGLTEQQQARMGSAVDSVAAPAATALVLAFKPGALPRPLPRGADEVTLGRAFPGWQVVAAEPAVVDGMPRPLRRATPTWYRLRRTG